MKYELGQDINVPCKITGAHFTKKSSEISYNTSIGLTFTEEQLDAFTQPVEKPTQPIAPQEDKAKFAVGQKVKVIGNCCCHGYSRGTILTLVRSVNFLRREPDWYVGEGTDYVSERDIEPYAEPEKEAVKLYCIKSDDGWCKFEKGNTYECNGLRIREGTRSTTYIKNSDWFKSHFVKLVKPPAKVGEYVMVENEAEPIQVSRFCGFRGDCVVLADGRHTKVLCREINYEVLDGYTPEPKKEPEPVGWNGKVVCTKSKVDFLTTGKVYTFKNGLSVDDVGDPLPFSKTLIKNAGELHCRSFGDFAPYLGEA